MVVDKRRELIYIAAPGYSGSTLLAWLLGSHPQIATVSEMTGLISSVDPETYKCSCGKRIRECPFWRALKERVADSGVDFDVSDFRLKFIMGENRLSKVFRSRSLHNRWANKVRDVVLKLYLPQRHDLANLRRRNLAFVDAVLEITGAQVFLDASKDPIRIKYLAEMPELRVKVIHLTRDARAVAHSYRKHRSHNVPIEAGARNWRWIHWDIHRFLEFPGLSDVFRVKYEQLATETTSTLNRLFQFCGVDPTRRIIVIRWTRSPPHWPQYEARQQVGDTAE